MFKKNINKIINTATMGFYALLLAGFNSTAYATVVEFRTVEGNFQVNLFDQTTPQTVTNFLDYVNSGAYANNVVHRSADNFVIQMGGYQYNNSSSLDPVPTGTPVNNEPALSNVRGTLAMAKLSGNPNSATSQFFVNLRDSSAGSARLDTTNGGFTVFGQVLGDGMEVVDRIAALPRFALSNTFNEIPLRNYTAADAQNNVELEENNFVIITDVVVIDSETVTNPNLNPVPNTLINSVPDTPDTPSSGGGGGSVGLFLICFLAYICLSRRRFK